MRKNATSSKILICSPIEAIRESLKLILSDTHDLILCEDSTQCFAIVKGAKIDLAFIELDVQESFDAVEALSKISPKIKIILITGHKSTRQAEEGLKKGASGFIVKPFRTEEIKSFCN